MAPIVPISVRRRRRSETPAIVGQPDPASPIAAGAADRQVVTLATCLREEIVVAVTIVGWGRCSIVPVAIVALVVGGPGLGWSRADDAVQVCYFAHVVALERP